MQRRSTGAADFSSRDSSTLTFTFRSCASSATMGRTLLDWLEHVALPEEARMADARYAADTARQFLRALASHGTTTALVFGAHFPSATAQLFEEAAAVRAAHRVGPGAFRSAAASRSSPHSGAGVQRRARCSSSDITDAGVCSYAVTPRFALSTSEAMLEVCQQLMKEHPRCEAADAHQREHEREVAEIDRLFPWAADYLAVYERYNLSGDRSVMAHNVHATPSQIERLAASRSGRCALPGQQRRSRQRLLSAEAARRRGCDVRARHRCRRRAGLRHAEGGASRLSDAASCAGSAAARCCASAVSGDARRRRWRSGSTATSATFSRARPPTSCIFVRRPTACSSRSCGTPTAPARRSLRLFTMAGSESVREVRVEGESVFCDRRMTIDDLNCDGSRRLRRGRRMGVRGFSMGRRARVGAAAVCNRRRAARGDDVRSGVCDPRTSSWLCCARIPISAPARKCPTRRRPSRPAPASTRLTSRGARSPERVERRVPRQVRLSLPVCGEGSDEAGYSQRARGATGVHARGGACGGASPGLPHRAISSGGCDFVNQFASGRNGTTTARAMSSPTG